MKKLLLTLGCIAALSTVAVAGKYSLVRAPTPGTHTVRIDGGGVGKIVQIEVYDSAVATGTVLLYRTTPGSGSTNLLHTLTCADGKAVVAITNSTLYLAAGDVLTRGGTATNGAVRIILE